MEEAVSVSQLKESLSEYLNRAAYGHERIVVASRGKPKAAVIGIEGLRRLEALEDALAAQEALAEYERGETISLDALITELAETGSDLPDWDRPPGRKHLQGAGPAFGDQVSLTPSPTKTAPY